MSTTNTNTGNNTSTSNNTNVKGGSNAPEVKNGFQIPKWASKPPNGLHLDVMKDGKMIQKLMIDEKKCYFFGRNKDTCDFVIDHASCSRVHAVLVWHKHLNRSFLIDLDSTHGTFIGSLRLEPNKPQQVFIDSELKFGASTRTYIIRERPQMNKHFPSILNNSNANNNSINDSSADEKDESFNQSLNLPESEAELDNLTEFNTAHNKRIAQLVDISSTNTSLPNNLPGIGPAKRKRKTVAFNEEEEVINPEDIDPSIGRFRNLVQTTIVIPNKKKRPSQTEFQNELSFTEKRIRSSDSNDVIKSDENSNDSVDEKTLYDDYDTNYGTFASNLGIRSLNLAPDVETTSATNEPSILHKQQQKHLEMMHRQHQQAYELSQQHQSNLQNHQTQMLDSKKKYAKESWPGRHTQSQAISISSTTVSPPSPPLRTSLSPTRPLTTLKPSPTTSSSTSNPTVSSSANPPAKRLII